jgi:hypothetical protein
LLFLKDVSFGVLYEQKKASEKLQNLINQTLNQRIGVPLEALIKTSKTLEESEEMEKIEATNWGMIALR